MTVVPCRVRRDAIRGARGGGDGDDGDEDDSADDEDDDSLADGDLTDGGSDGKE